VHRSRAVEGKANSAVLRALADAFDLPLSSVRIVYGRRTRTKVVELDSADPKVVTALLLW